jgi:hypothetical protein
MKFIKHLSFNFKNKVTYITFFLVCGMLFNTYSNLSSSKLFSFFVEPKATIIASKTNVCIGESVTITFEGLEGRAPYVFTYELNGVEQDTVKSNNGSLREITRNNPLEGSFIYKLIKV